MQIISEIEHLTEGAYVVATVVKYRELTTVSDAEAVGQTLESCDVDGFVTCPEDLKGDIERLEENIEELEGDVEKAQDEASAAESDRDNMRDERDEALDKLETFMNNAGWKMEREKEFERIQEENRAVFSAIWEIRNWAGKNKTKAQAAAIVERLDKRIAEIRNAGKEKAAA